MKTIASILILLTGLNTMMIAQNTQVALDGGLFDDQSVEWSEYDQTYVVAVMNSNSDVRLTKITPAGAIVWTQAYTLGNGSTNGIPDLEILPDGMIFTCGFYSGQFSRPSYYVLSVFPWGQEFWAKCYEASWNTYTVLGGPSLTLMTDGNFMITEKATDHAGYIKVNPAGTLIGSTAYRVSPDPLVSTLSFASAIYPDGSMIFTASQEGHIMLVKAHPDGQIQWSKVMSSDSTPADPATDQRYYQTKDVVALSDGSAITCGYENRSGFLMRTDPAGNVVWFRREVEGPFLGLIGAYHDLGQIDSSTFIAAGFDTIPYLTKFDGDGNIISTVRMGTSAYVYYGYGVTLNPAGQIMWPTLFYDQLTAYSVIGLNYMSDVTAFGCDMNTYSRAFEPNPRTPADINVPVYAEAQVIDGYSLSIVPVSDPVYSDDFCAVVHVPEQTAQSTLIIRNTSLDPTAPLYFSLGEYAGEIVYTIYDMNGRAITSVSEDMDAGEVVSSNTQVFAAGLYVLTVQAGEKVFAEKFIVRE